MMRGQHGKRVLGSAAIPLVACVLLLIATAATLVYYIFGPSLAFFHADCTDSLLWAQVTVETGQLLADDFHYAALLPFGSSLWMVPIVSVFGYTITAQHVSMAVFAVLFIAAAFWCFRTLRFGPVAASGATFVLTMLLSSSPKLRELFWEHTIYYSLSVLVILLLVPLTVRLSGSLHAAETKDKQGLLRVIFYTLLVWGLCVGCGMDGVQVMVLTAVPVVGAWLATAVLDDQETLTAPKHLRTYVTVAVMAVGVLCGLFAMWVMTKGGRVNAPYENAFSGFAAFDTWDDNAHLFLPHFLSLCGVSATLYQPLVSGETLLTMLKLAVAWAVLLLPVLLLCRYRTLQSRAVKVMALTHALLCAVILFAFICGLLSNANWRLTPMLGTGIVTSLLYIRELFGGSRVQKRIAALLAALLMTVSVANAWSMWAMEPTAGANTANIRIAQTLTDKGCEYGYATFWNAHNTTLLANGEVTVLPVEVNGTGVRSYDYQVRNAWFEEAATADGPFFLLLRPAEYDTWKAGRQYQTLLTSGAIVEDYEQDGFRVVICNRNPLV